MRSHDIFHKFHEKQGYFGTLRLAGDRYFCNPVLPSSTEHRTNYGGQQVISWSLNNYLGLANHPKLRRQVQKAVAAHGISSPMGSRMLTGTTQRHLDLERELADFAQKEAAYLFNYGYLGVIGTICSMVGPHDTVVVDKLAHACIVDGAMLSRATVRIFKHNNMDDLERKLRRINRIRRGGLLIAVEGVYGMTGDIADLRTICELASKYEARVFVDDAHGWGVMGERGSGSGEFYQVQDKIDLYFGTFAKAFAAIGGMTAGSQAVRDWIAFNARTQVFAKSLPMVYVEALHILLGLVRDASGRRAALWHISKMIKSQLGELGFFIGSGRSPICSLFIPLADNHPETLGMRLVQWLRERGIFVSAVTYPVIPRDLLMFRIVPTAAHTPQDVQESSAIFKKMRDTLKLRIKLSSDEQERLSRIYNDEAVFESNPKTQSAPQPALRLPKNR